MKRLIKSVLIGLLTSVCVLSAYQAGWIGSYLVFEVKDWIILLVVGGISGSVSAYIMDWVLS